MPGAISAVASFIGSVFTGGGGGPIGQILGSIMGPFSGFVAPIVTTLLGSALFGGGGESGGGGGQPAAPVSTPAKTPTMPLIGDLTTTTAKAKSVSTQSDRRGRLATILSDLTPGMEIEKLGG